MLVASAILPRMARADAAHTEGKIRRIARKSFLPFRAPVPARRRGSREKQKPGPTRREILKNTGPEQVRVGQQHGQRQNAEDGAPDHRLAPDAVADRASNECSRSDGLQEKTNK